MTGTTSVSLSNVHICQVQYHKILGAPGPNLLVSWGPHCELGAPLVPPFANRFDVPLVPVTVYLSCTVHFKPLSIYRNEIILCPEAVHRDNVQRSGETKMM